MNQESFDLIKSLLNAGATTGVIRKVTAFSASSISTVRRTSNLEQYFSHQREYLRLKRNSKTFVGIKTVMKTPEKTENDNILSELKKTNILLQKLINEIEDSKGFKPFRSLFSK